MKALSVAVAILLAAVGNIGDAAARKIALVIGNDAYSDLPVLQKAVNDGVTMAETLRAIGYEVIEGSDLTRRQTSRLFSDFERRIEVGDEAFLYFAGHGVAIGSENYLIPTDMPLPRPGEEGLVRDEGHSVTEMVERIQARGAKTAILVLDACRNNPFKARGVRSIGRSAGLAESSASSGVFMLYSAGYGQAALDRLSDDDPDPNSVFTRTLAPLLRTPGLSHVVVAKRVQQQVSVLAQTVSHRQQPAYYDQIIGEIVFRPGDAPVGGGDAAQAWASASTTESRGVLQALIDRYDGSIYADFARARLDELESAGGSTERASLDPDPGSDPPDCGSIERASVGGAPCLSPDPQAQEDIVATGDADELIRLALAYETGDGVTTSATRAAELYRDAAGKDSVTAMRRLGDLYWRGAPDLARDDAEAVAWYRRAADSNNDPASLTALGIAFRTGRGVERDTEAASNWLRWAVGDAEPVDLAGKRRLRAFPAASYGAGNRFEILGRPVGILEIEVDAGTMKCGAMLIDENRILSTRSCRYDSELQRAAFVSVNAVFRDARSGEVRRYPVDPDPVESDVELDFAIFETQGSPGRDFGTVPLATQDGFDAPVFRIVADGDDHVPIALSLQCTPALLPAASGVEGKTCALPWTAGVPLFDMYSDTAVAMIASPRDDTIAVPFSRIAERSGIVADLLARQADPRASIGSEARPVSQVATAECDPKVRASVGGCTPPLVEGDTGSLPQIEAIRDRGVLNCGVSAESISSRSILASSDTGGAWSGFDVDICRAIAAATLGDADAVTVLPTPTRDMETALVDGEIDVFAGAYDVRLRGPGSGVASVGTTLIDGLGFLAGKDIGIVSALEMGGARVCVRPGTRDEERQHQYFANNGMDFEPVVFFDLDEGLAAYESGRCDVLVADVTQLAGAVADGAMTGHLILPETLTVEPRGPVVSVASGHAWRDIAAAVVNALIAAEERGIAQAGADRGGLEDVEAAGERLGLPSGWAARTIAAVGHYGEIFARNLGDRTPLGLPRGRNALVVDGGMIAAR